MEGDQAAAGSATDRLTRLTLRDRNVLLLVGSCMQYREVAGLLGVTASAVRAKVKVVCKKLELGHGRPKELLIGFYQRHRNLLVSEKPDT